MQRPTGNAQRSVSWTTVMTMKALMMAVWRSVLIRMPLTHIIIADAEPIARAHTHRENEREREKREREQKGSLSQYLFKNFRLSNVFRIRNENAARSCLPRHILLLCANAIGIYFWIKQFMRVLDDYCVWYGCRRWHYDEEQIERNLCFVDTATHNERDVYLPMLAAAKTEAIYDFSHICILLVSLFIPIHASHICISITVYLSNGFGSIDKIQEKTCWAAGAVTSERNQTPIKAMGNILHYYALLCNSQCRTMGLGWTLVFHLFSFFPIHSIAEESHFKTDLLWSFVCDNNWTMQQIRQIECERRAIWFSR